jgi:dolichol-phosphate mannosyltransferase
LAGLGFLYAIFLGIRAVAGASPPEGWTTVVVLVLILGGVQLIVLGIFGEYLWRATDEARRRPVYVVRTVEKSGAHDQR